MIVTSLLVESFTETEFTGLNFDDKDAASFIVCNAVEQKKID